MKLGVGAFLTDCGLGICELARQIEDAGLESLFLVQNTHVPVSGTSLLEVEHHERDHHFLDPSWLSVLPPRLLVVSAWEPASVSPRSAIRSSWRCRFPRLISCHRDGSGSG